MSKTLVMGKKMGKRPKISKAEKRRLHHLKNALKMHAKVCRAETCMYAVEYGREARRIHDEAVLDRHLKVCCAPEKRTVRSPFGGMIEEPCECSKLLQNVSCINAVIAENAAAEIERHLAAIRKIKKTRAPLKGDEAYHVYPEVDRPSGNPSL